MDWEKATYFPGMPSVSEWSPKSGPHRELVASLRVQFPGSDLPPQEKN